MSEVKNVLIVTNSICGKEIDHICESVSVAQQENTSLKINLVHVIPSLPACYFSIPSMTQLAERYYQEATDILGEAGQRLHVAKRDQWLVTGKLRNEVLRLAGQLHTQFILAGKECISTLQQQPFLPMLRKQASPTAIGGANHLLKMRGFKHSLNA